MFWDNLESACTAAGLKVTPLLKELNISTGNIGRWQKGGTVTSDTVVILAKRLGVTTDYLLTGEHRLSEAPDALKNITQSEVDLLKMYRVLNGMQKEFIYDAIRSAYDRVMEEGQSERKAL